MRWLGIPPTTRFWSANDGGLYMFDPGTSTPTFTSLNQDINAAQIQGIGPHPTDSTKLIAGFQNHGTQIYHGLVSNWFAPDSETGDGGFALYDLRRPKFRVSRLFSRPAASCVGLGFHRRWTNMVQRSRGKPRGMQCVRNQWSPALRTLINAVADPGPAFYPPLAVDPTGRPSGLVRPTLHLRINRRDGSLGAADRSGPHLRRQPRG